MKAKNLLIALKTDAEGGFEEFSHYHFVFLDDPTIVLTTIEYIPENDQIYLAHEAKKAPLTLNQLVQFLNQHKEAVLYLQKDKRLIYGYKLLANGISLG